MLETHKSIIMGKFITLREEFESETGKQDDQSYIEWLERLVELQEEMIDNQKKENLV